jgi:hypothetical protein
VAKSGYDQALQEEDKSFAEQLVQIDSRHQQQESDKKQAGELRRQKMENDIAAEIARAQQAIIFNQERVRSSGEAIDKAGEDLTALKLEVLPLVDLPTRLESIRSDINDIRDKLKIHKEYADYQVKRDRVREKETEVALLKEKYANEDFLFKYYSYTLPKLLIDRCKLPVPEVEFRDNELYVQNRHIDRLSTAERALVSTQIGIALARAQGHIAITVDGIECFDKEHREIFLKATEQEDICVLYTRYSEGEDVLPNECKVENGKIIQ